MHLNFSFQQVAKGKPFMLHLEHEFRIGDFMPPGMLVGMDIIDPRTISSNISGRQR
jgi:hypothetical protein